ncbi:LysR family transcriptional regulator [Vibrio mangrovi]|uniref:HTH-type transcriptional regulator CynR n=1 Tax=Vibrio mangrovi TaxID=474394 RepID=A0A1Y6IVG8_9VIBR|nr:LysR family transcriptional regulator [Vibrio mangrovi]MDW6004892.1 LysR family transcriptional regulator [Vibrio mangrovi]SMS01654.1 HTH-type transcriptional regulator CynR [Vibrio mangrovi]
MSMTIRQLKYFVAAAELGQVSQAAIHLSISQSAVTTAIRELETLLGVNLFVRSTQGVTLTDRGRHFLNHAYQVLRSVDEALNIPHTDEDAMGSVRLAATYTAQGYLLPYHLQRLRQWYPNISIDLYEFERTEIEDKLLDGSIDMAIVLTDNLIESEIVSEKLFSSERRLWMPSHHHLSQKKTLALEDVEKEPFIMLTVDEADVSAMRYWSLKSLQPNVILRTSSVESVRSMVANGLGVAILSDLVYRPWSLEGRRIETRSLDDVVYPMSVGLAWKRGKTFTQAMHAIRGYFQQVYLTPQQNMVRSTVV